MKPWVVLLLVGLAPGILHGSDSDVIAVGRFSEMMPGVLAPGWESMTFDKIASHTRYTLVVDDGRTVLQAKSSASASGLIKHVNIDPIAYPVLTWDWKVSNIIASGDITLHRR